MANRGGILKSAEHYRTRALEVRAIAHALAEGGAARKALLEVADEYDRVAKAMDAQGKGDEPPDKA